MLGNAIIDGKKMNQKTLCQKITLYDPHPGFGGPPRPLPEPMKDLADRLDLQTMTLAEAIWKIKPVASELGGSLSTHLVTGNTGYIGFELPEGPGFHFWRLIRYTLNPNVIKDYIRDKLPN